MRGGTTLENVMFFRALCSVVGKSNEAGEGTWVEVCKDVTGETVLCTGFSALAIAFWLIGNAEE